MKMAIYMPKRDACKQEKNKECHSSSSYIRFRHNHCSHDSVARMKIQEETFCVGETGPKIDTHLRKNFKDPRFLYPPMHRKTPKVLT